MAEKSDIDTVKMKPVFQFQLVDEVKLNALKESSDQQGRLFASDAAIAQLNEARETVFTHLANLTKEHDLEVTKVGDVYRITQPK